MRTLAIYLHGNSSYPERISDVVQVDSDETFFIVETWDGISFTKVRYVLSSISKIEEIYTVPDEG